MAENPARAEVLRTRDLTGWAVGDPAGVNVGTVSDLLIGRDGRVRFLAVKRGMLGSTVLVPVDELDWGEQSMRLVRWTDADVRQLPPYDGGEPISAEVVAELERAYPRFYGPHPGFDAPEGQGTILPLREAREFRLPKTAPNLRGWTVFGDDNERVGVAEEMLVDPAQMKVMYLEVDVADDLFLLRDDRHVVVPMDAVELRERNEDAWVRGLTARQIAELPAYTGGPLDPIVEQRVLQAFNRAASPIPEAHRASLDLPPPQDYETPPPLPPGA